MRYALGGACRPAGGTGAAAEPAGADGAAAASSAPCAAAARPTITAPLVSGRPSIANTTNIETLVKALQEATAPSEQVQDKVGFIFNNLSQINLSQKCEDLLEVLERDYWPWFSQYVVMRRVRIEPNFHVLYASFMDALRLPDLLQLCVRELFRNIHTGAATCRQGRGEV